MKPVVLILASAFLSLPAFADVATISGSNTFTFQTTECVVGIGCGVIIQGAGEEIDVDSQGNIFNIETFPSSGPWGQLLFGGAAPEIDLPAGSVVTGATVALTITNAGFSDSGPAFTVTGDSTISEVQIGTACASNGPGFDIMNPAAHSVTDPFTTCPGPDIQFSGAVFGTGSVNGFVSQLPTDPGSHFYQGDLFQTVDYTISVDYTNLTATPEPAEFIPLGLTSATLLFFSRRARSARSAKPQR
jgi:hypothetical protein